MIELPAAIRIYFLILSFLFGACIGSFVTCAADRYVSHESVWKGRSHCPSCGHSLTVLDLFPILSYIFLRGRCRYCGARIPVRCLFTETLCGFAFFAIAWFYGFSFATLEYCLLVSALLGLSLIDYDTMEIPDGLLLFGAVVFLVFLPAHEDMVDRVTKGLLSAVIFGGGMLLVSLVMDAILKKDSLGGGDIKLFAMLGLYFGIWQGLLNLILSCIIGLIFAVSRGKDFENEFPFGPAIAYAALITLLLGPTLIDIYLEIIL